MSAFDDAEKMAESAIGGGGGGGLEQDVENMAVKEGEQELGNVAGQGIASDVENALGGTQGIDQDIGKL